MKQKTHSGAKKTVKRKKRILVVDKAAKRHLLVNKSKDQKSITVVPVSSARLKAVRKMLGGIRVPKKAVAASAK